MPLPSFPIKFSHRGATYRAIFKPTDKPTHVRVFVTDLERKPVADKILRLSLGTSEGWVALAKEAMNGHAKAPLQKSRDAQAGDDDDSVALGQNPVLHDMRGDQLQTFRGLQAAGQGRGPSEAYLKIAHRIPIPAVDRLGDVVFVKDAKLDELYVTVPASPNQDNRDKMFLTRVEGQAEPSKFESNADPKFYVWVYFPFPLQEWKRMKVPGRQLLKVYPAGPGKDFYLKKRSSSGSNSEGGRMPTAVKEKTAPKKSVGRKTGLSVMESWGVAFEKFGTVKNAPEKIVAHMEADFPDKDTQWAKWVNSIRAAYNRGDKRLGVKKPKEPIPSYSGRRNPAANGKPAPVRKGGRRASDPEVVED